MKDAKFQPIVKKLVGLHQVKFPTLFEITCWAILAQRSQMPVAKRAKTTLTEKFGGSLEVDERMYRAFPDYQTLKSGGSVKEILSATRNRRSAERLSSLLSSFDELDKVHATPEGRREAEEDKGNRGLVRPVHPLPRAGENTKKLESQDGTGHQDDGGGVWPGDDPVEEINRTYGEWCGYWSLYLWASGMASRTAAQGKVTTR